MRNISLKFYSLIFFALIFVSKISAQDTIIKINGEQIPARIIEITSTEIKYKKINFLDGPTYIENKSNVQLIKYANGLKENFQSAQIQPQNNIVKANGKKDTLNKTTAKIETDDYYGKPEIAGVKSGQLSVTKKIFKQNNDIITEKQFYTLLKQTNDKEIIALTEKSMKAKKRQYISFGCIIGGTSFLIIWPIFFVVEPIPVLLYYNFRSVRKTSNKKAVELYNKKQ